MDLFLKRGLKRLGTALVVIIILVAIGLFFYSFPSVLWSLIEIVAGLVVLYSLFLLILKLIKKIGQIGYKPMVVAAKDVDKIRV